MGVRVARESKIVMGALLPVLVVGLTGPSQAAAPSVDPVASTPPSTYQAAAERSQSATESRVKRRCIYQVQRVRRVGSVFIGNFVVLRKSGRKLSGYGGAFNSEYSEIRGRIIRKPGGFYAKLTTFDPYDPTVRETTRVRWVVKKQKLAGWSKVRKAKIRKYSDGNLPFANRACG